MEPCPCDDHMCGSRASNRGFYESAVLRCPKPSPNHYLSRMLNKDTALYPTHTHTHTHTQWSAEIPLEMCFKSFYYLGVVPGTQRHTLVRMRRRRRPVVYCRRPPVPHGHQPYQLAPITLTGSVPYRWKTDDWAGRPRPPGQTTGTRLLPDSSAYFRLRKCHSGEASNCRSLRTQPSKWFAFALHGQGRCWCVCVCAPCMCVSVSMGGTTL